MPFVEEMPLGKHWTVHIYIGYYYEDYVLTSKKYSSSSRLAVLGSIDVLTRQRCFLLSRIILAVYFPIPKYRWLNIKCAWEMEKIGASPEARILLWLGGNWREGRWFKRGDSTGLG